MKNILKNYKGTVILLIGILLGAFFGLIFREKAAIVSPLGDLFLNLLLISVVPLIFLSITTAITKMDKPKRLGKILTSILIVFAITSVLATLVGFISIKNVNLVNTKDSKILLKDVDYSKSSEKVELNLLERTVDTISVSDFQKLFTNQNMVALIIFSILIGLSVNKAGKKGENVKKLLESGMDVLMEFIKLIMYYAPIGLGCYFAALIGTMGSVIAVGYLKTFVIYFIVSGLFFFVVYSIYAYIAGGKKGFINFWKNIIPVTVTALGTCSSAASIPANMDFTKKIGVPEDIANSTISLGTSFHKDGSNIGSVFKIMFLVSIFGTSLSSAGAVLQILGVALLATILVTAVPIGGGTISEMLIITMMGFPIGALPMLTIIATIIDAPATLLNVVGDSSASMLVTRMVEGKDWIK